ncbi:hypothetical protein DFH07DRAFT_762575 [Mycena maculata]|uniref:SWIM-type domain-containing protein n=1 Tax=Mycena maculata TaxID=230809 RepID=A0AAD7MGC2_9AGAR|nr:hypothetical protein DFH07DRAFT_762575 [Mycena maculata]
MISSDATEVTVDWFFVTFRQLNWEVIPLRIMCGHDRATMNVVWRRFIESQLLLCWWHVPHAWQKHFCIAHYPELWAEMKCWFRITDPDEFLVCWARIQELAPESVVTYLVRTWLVDKELWSAIYRQDRNIFELSDTNMLVEVWHHILKSKHMQAKQGRRVDNLIHTLINVAMPHYIAGHRAQEFGFQGPNLEVRERMKIKVKAESILPESIREIEAGKIFEVQSQSDPTNHYTVNIDENTCPCRSFPLISFCKHICAVQNNYPDVAEHQSFRPEPLGGSLAAPGRSSGAGDATGPPPSTTTTPSDKSDHHLLLDYILHKLQHLKRTNVTPSVELTDSLRTLDTSLNAAVRDQILLPKIKKDAPNMHSWTETQQQMLGGKKVIAAAKKGPRKRVHIDAHAGGQGSGKQAQPDARAPKRPWLSPVSTREHPIAGPSTAAATPAHHDFPQDTEFPTSYSEPGPSELPCHLDRDSGAGGSLDLPVVSDSRSPQEVLLETLRLYNTMFQIPASEELDESQPVVVAAPRPSYYREHLYN